MKIRPEELRDIDRIREVTRRAFDSDVEPAIIDALRMKGSLTLSLVADDGDGLVGHAAFSPVRTADDQVTGQPLGLGPIAVRPDVQRTGIGSQLVRAGLEACRQLDTAYIVVLGDPAYYGRFGFRPASLCRLRCEFTDSDAFQVLVLDKHRLPAPGSLIAYDPAFDV